MTRKKVKLAFISNDSARKATYKKRKRGLLKKMDELTTLCDVKACAILYSPYEARPVVWPGPSGARDVISSFNRLPEMEKVKKMVSQEKFLRDRVAKAHEQLKRQQKENREKDMTHVMYQCLSGKDKQNLSLLDLSDLGWVINQHLTEINKRIQVLKKENHTPQNNNNSITNNNSSSKNHLVWGPPLGQHAMGPGSVNEGLRGQKKDFDAKHMQMMAHPWPSFMDMLGPPLVNDQHQHQHHGIGIGGGLGNGLSGGAYDNPSSSTTRNNYNNNMNNMMMMGQFGDYPLGHGVNSALWSNNAFLP
ncbi:Agamous-like MADS-box protein AGL80 [Bienertia sinuspersici]